MGEKLVVGPINKGLKTDREPFVIDNDSFPTIINAYQWRGRVKRKRGTSPVCRLMRQIGTTDGSGNATITISPTPITSGIASFFIGTDIFVDPGGSSPVTLLTNSSGSATLNRTTGVLTILGSQISTAVIYYPSLPVMGLEDLRLNPNSNPGTIAFDTRYAYNVSTSYNLVDVNPYPTNDISFYKNPPSGLYPSYVQKSTWTPLWWNGKDYQQFWTTNYEGAFWATNGVTVPFNITNIGMQYKPIVSVTVTSSGPPAIVSLNIVGHGLVVGDFLFINEVVTTTGINFQTGYVITVTDANNVVVEFPNATITTNGTGGIAQYLTSRSDPTKDCIRWYDGDPTNSSPTNQTFVAAFGWVNFCPPLCEAAYSIANLPPAIWYLVGAKMIFPFKDRLLMIGPVVQTSTAGSQVYLQDTVIYSQNGTPYYTASYTNKPLATADTPTSITNQFTALLVPPNQTATPCAWFEDQVGFGGFVSAGISDAIITCSPNEDVLILGFNTIQTRLINTGNDATGAFEFFIINSELGSSSTFSFINMDQGILSKGPRGYIMTTQVNAQRIDTDIPDQAFETNLLNNGNERFCAQRDYISEWIYFTYNSDSTGDALATYLYPNQTLLFNYRDNSYAIFNETYTTYGAFRVFTGLTWATLPSNLTWESWNTPWNSGDNNILQPNVIAGNQEGFVVFRSDATQGTSEAASLYIQYITGNTVTVPNHSLNNTDYIIINGALGAIGSQINGIIFQVFNVTTNTFMLNPSVTSTGSDYEGGGYITRMYVPFIQTKQFPVAWGMGRKTRIGPQMYLFSKTDFGQCTVQIYLSQNAAFPYNSGTIVPDPASLNNALIYSQVVFTCPESTNLGLTPANINLQMLTATNQKQIWHRMNTSLIGDTVQLGFTFSDAQMRDVNFSNQFTEFELHAFILDLSPSMLLA